MDLCDLLFMSYEPHPVKTDLELALTSVKDTVTLFAEWLASTPLNERDMTIHATNLLCKAGKH